MNDLPSVIKHSKICLYVNNVKLFMPIISSLDFINFQSDIDSLSCWCKEWSLKLNLKKCLILDFGPHTDNLFPCTHFLDGEQIANTNLYTDLDSMTSFNFNFSSHHFCIVNSAHSRTDLIRRAFPFSNIPTQCKFVCTYVRPTLEYCNT